MLVENNLAMRTGSFPSSERPPDWPRKRIALVLLAQLLVALLGLLDYATGVKFHFALFYLAPICLASLRGGLIEGLATSASSTLVLFLAEKAGGADLGNAWLTSWEALARLAGFSFVAVLLARTEQLNQRLMEKARSLALETEKRQRVEDEKANELRKHSEQVIQAQEGERRRIASDLHDSVNQLLSTVTFRLGMLAEDSARYAPRLTEDLAQARLLLTRGIEEIHRISEGLRPSELDALGLAPALRSLCREFQAKAKVALKAELDLPPARLPDKIELTLYRIIQEALNNIEKHSGASHATLHLQQNGSCVKLTIHDNGKGLQPASEKPGSPRRAGMGLLNMRERAAFLGGTFSIHSNRGKGTEVVVQVPLSRAEPN